MSLAYVDSSALIAVELEEPHGDAVGERLNNMQRLSSSNLLEAEVRSAFAREGREFDERLVSRFQWVLPDRTLSLELATVLEAGYLRGADLWHVAVALFASPDPSQITFITLDNRQREVASALGFQT